MKSFHEKNQNGIAYNAHKYGVHLSGIMKVKGPIACVEEAYRLIDYSMRVANTQKPFSCSKGCSFCCHDRIDMSGLEAMYIQEKADVSKADLAMGSVQIEEKEFFDLKWADRKCPMLQKDGSCGIYEHRPGVCRRHNSLSHPSLCKREDPKALTTKQAYSLEAEGILLALSMMCGHKNEKDLISMHQLFNSKDPVRVQIK